VSTNTSPQTRKRQANTEPPDESETAQDANPSQSQSQRKPSYRLERIDVRGLQVDYAPPYGTGYARPLSEHRLRQLRRDWDPLAVSPMTLSRREDGSLWIIDGNHRRVVAADRDMLQLPAMIHSGLTREQEADLYTKLGTVLGQTPFTRFQAKLVAQDPSAIHAVRIATEAGLILDANLYADRRIQAIARVEWIYARSGPEALEWVLGFLMSAFGGMRESLGEMQLEGVFGFYARYADFKGVQRDEIARILGASGIDAWHDRAASIWQRVDVGKRSNTYGMALADVLNDFWRKQGKKPRDLLPAWVPNLGQANPRFRNVSFSSRMNWGAKSPEHNPAPQQLEDVTNG
jgi:hypothetical protein